ncbi:MAG: PKD domain-containing protein [Candidatus Sumerlaeia bacterium]|nr:PKD domain-containing protein [Candidatus Sumerlaeia bacterium]
MKTSPLTQPWFLRRHVIGQAPTADATPTTSSGAAPLEVTFSNTSFDVDGSIQAVHWTFGDGSYSTEWSPTKLYRSPGNYTARLAVTDDQGNVAHREFSIDVEPAGTFPEGMFMF